MRTIPAGTTNPRAGENTAKKAPAAMRAVAATIAGKALRSRTLSTASVSAVMRPRRSLLRRPATRSRGSARARSNNVTRSRPTSLSVTEWVEIRSP